MENRRWTFKAYKSEVDYRNGNYYFLKIFDDHTAMKVFSANHSYQEKKKHPNYCSTYTDYQPEQNRN